VEAETRFWDLILIGWDDDTEKVNNKSNIDRHLGFCFGHLFIGVLSPDTIGEGLPRKKVIFLSVD
jgi:hypothetical protein